MTGWESSKLRGFGEGVERQGWGRIRIIFHKEGKLNYPNCKHNSYSTYPHFTFCSAFTWLCGVHKETESVKRKQRSQSYSPIGAIANELDGLKVTLQWFPARRGAGCSALNQIHPMKKGKKKKERKTLTLTFIIHALHDFIVTMGRDCSALVWQTSEETPFIYV